MNTQAPFDNEVFYTQVDLQTVFSVSKATITRWKKNGLLPQPVEINGFTRYSSRDITRLVDQQNPYRNKKSDIAEEARKLIEEL